MNIALTKPLRLLTKDKVCRENLDIIPVLQTMIVDKNGFYIADDGYVGLKSVYVRTPEASAGVLDNLESPILPKFGRLKYYEPANMYVRYKDVYPTAVYDSSQQGVTAGGGVYPGTSPADAYNGLYVDYTHNVPLQSTINLIRDGKMYDAYAGCTAIAALWASIWESGTASVPAVYILPCICRVSLYDPIAQELRTEEHTISGQFLEARECSAGTVNVAANWLDIVCASSAYILGAEFVYEKHSITFSGGAETLTYSLDNSASYHAVTDGLTLPEAEHITFENAADTAVKIGSTAGASDYATVPAGGRLTVAVPAGGTWYVS